MTSLRTRSVVAYERRCFLTFDAHCQRVVLVINRSQSNPGPRVQKYRTHEPGQSSLAAFRRFLRRLLSLADFWSVDVYVVVLLLSRGPPAQLRSSLRAGRGPPTGVMATRTVVPSASTTGCLNLSCPFSNVASTVIVIASLPAELYHAVATCNEPRTDPHSAGSAPTPFSPKPPSFTAPLGPNSPTTPNTKTASPPSSSYEPRISASALRK